MSNVAGDLTWASTSAKRTICKMCLGYVSLCVFVCVQHRGSSGRDLHCGGGADGRFGKLCLAFLFSVFTKTKTQNTKHSNYPSRQITNGKKNILDDMWLMQMNVLHSCILNLTLVSLAYSIGAAHQLAISF